MTNYSFVKITGISSKITCRIKVVFLYFVSKPERRKRRREENEEEEEREMEGSRNCCYPKFVAVLIYMHTKDSHRQLEESM